MSVFPDLNELPGPIPLLVSIASIGVLASSALRLSQGKRDANPKGVAAYVLAIGLVGIVAMVTASFFYRFVPAFSPRQWAQFFLIFTTFGATTLMFGQIWMGTLIFWPDLFSGTRAKAAKRTRLQNLTISFLILLFIYGFLSALMVWGPDKFIDSPPYRTKSELFTILFGAFENLLTLAWFASTFFGGFVAAAIYLAFYELVVRTSQVKK